MRARPAALAIVMAALSIALPARAQEGQREGPPRRGREEAFRMVDAYILGNLQEALDLSDDQYLKLLPLVKRLQSDRRMLAQRRGRALHELRRALHSGQATEPRVQELLRELKAVEEEGPPTVHRDIRAIDDALSAVQQAKYRVLEAEVERKLRELMGRTRGRGRPGPRTMRPAPPVEREP